MRRIQYIFSICTVFSLFFVVSLVSAAEPGVTINGGDSSVQSHYVHLYIVPTSGAKYMRISDDSNMEDDTWVAVRQHVSSWELPFGNGVKTAYVQFQYANASLSGVYTDSIQLSAQTNMSVSVAIDNDKRQTDSRYVTIDIEASIGVDDMMVSNEPTFTGVSYRPIAKKIQWVLSSGSGEKIVYFRFRDAQGTIKNMQKAIQFNAPERTLSEGSFVKGQGTTVYYIGYGGRMHPVPNSAVYQSYLPGFASVMHVSDTKLQEYFVGSMVCMRPGTWLLKFSQSPRIYAPEPGCMLRPLRSQSEAFILYGETWQERILEVPPYVMGGYNIHSLTTESRANDADRDGIDKETEKWYGSSDTKDDSDGDGLSDYEEIMYWFTDPKKVDTDEDGIGDGDEILLRQSPNGFGELIAIPENTYSFPYGSVVYKWWSDKKFYYFHQSNDILYLSDNIHGKAFEGNNFQLRFVITPPFKLPFTPRNKWYILESSEYIRDPLSTQYGSVIPL
ncbi:hypothetical protein KKG22_01130 [Patescibacteria group bacterium]|nr:hypothetical protein [Patescibacteria group bacterium]MBU1722038.1 hypothetical protein [Patescibacteria group bacterium]MBU1901759.1 hypothetical protein [Patescibacteria group bacterium]